MDLEAANHKCDQWCDQLVQSHRNCQKLKRNFLNGHILNNIIFIGLNPTAKKIIILADRVVFFPFASLCWPTEAETPDFYQGIYLTKIKIHTSKVAKKFFNVIYLRYLHYSYIIAKPNESKGQVKIMWTLK